MRTKLELYGSQDTALNYVLRDTCYYSKIPAQCLLTFILVEIEPDHRF